MSNFADGLFQYNGCPVGLPYFPALRKGAKVFFVDPNNGKDTASGLKPEAALDTVAAAFDKTTDKAGDVVILLSDGSTTGSARDEAIVWDHSNTHLIGVTAPGLNKRARIAPASAVTDVDAYTPYITLSGSGCIFANFSLFQGNSEDGKSSVGILLSGSQNYLYGLDIMNGAHANQGDEACYQLQISGSENVIEKCFIGTDTYSRGNNSVSANIAFTGGTAARNVIRDCILSMYADDTEPVFVLADASTVDRWQLMERCVCVNTSPVLTAATTIAAGVSWSNTSGGMLLLKDTGFYGCTDVTAADATKVVVYGPTPGTPVDAGLFKGVDVA
jgi:hypothetical protein